MKLIRVLSALGVFICFLLWVSSALASRNSSGTMSVPNTFVTGAASSAPDMNTNFSDFATEMTDSLNRSGKGGMLAALRGTDGTVTAPAFAFTSETGTGLYRIGSSDLGLAVNQSKVGEWTANGYLSANGAVATPSISFSNDTGSGLYRIGSNDIGFAINGVKKLELTSSLFTVVPNISLTGFVSSNLGVGVAPLFPLHILKTGSSGATASANTVAMFEGSGTPIISLLAPNAQNEALCFGDVANSCRGLIQYFNSTNGSADQMQISTGGTLRATVSNSGLTIGSGGTATTQLNFGSCTTNAGTPSVCTATVASGAKCVANPVGTAASTDSVTNSVSGTTLTITIQNGVAKTINYICF